MQTVLDEIVEKAADLTDEERRELIQLLQEQEKSNQKNDKGQVSPNTIWIKENHAEYAGNYVALKDGKLVAVGKTIKEADMAAQAKGVDKPMLTYLFPLDEVPFGGW